MGIGKFRIALSKLKFLWDLGRYYWLFLTIDYSVLWGIIVLISCINYLFADEDKFYVIIFDYIRESMLLIFLKLFVDLKLKSLILFDGLN